MEDQGHRTSGKDAGAAQRASALSATGALEGLAREAIHRMSTGQGARRKASSATLSGEDMERFLEILVRGDIPAGLALVEARLEHSRSYVAVADGLFTSAARELGARWEDDRLSFFAVGVGISSLLAINSMARRDHGLPSAGTNGQVLFATLAPQAHTFGAILAAEAFRQSDYEVALLLGSDADTILDEISTFKVPLVGFTAGRSDRLADIRALARHLKALPNPPAILLGGNAAGNAHGMLDEGSIDCIAHSIDEALDFAHHVELA
jgi:hypothetical protein